MGRTRSSSSSSIESSSKSNPFGASTSRNLSTDLRLGLSFGSAGGSYYNGGGAGGSGYTTRRRKTAVDQEVDDDDEEEMMEMEEDQENECNSVGSFYVKVNMEGVPIGRKIDLLALHGYHDLIRTLDLMFNTAILWAEEEEMYREKTHVLTYADKEGDWMMVGDVPWEMFLSSVRRLKITRAYNY